MDKRTILKQLIGTLFLLLAVALVIYAYHNYVQSNLKQDINVLSGATQIYRI